MGTTSDKLTYLNTTKGKIKDVINMTGANITSDTTFRNYATKLYNGYISVLKDKNTLLDNMPKGTSMGTVTDAADLPVYEDKMSKESTQETTTGKNIFNPVNINGTTHGITYSYDSDTHIYTLNGIATQDNTIIPSIAYDTINLIKNSTTLSVHYVSGSATGGAVQFLTSSYSGLNVKMADLSTSNPVQSFISTINGTTYKYNSRFRVDTGNTFNNFKFKIMVADSNDTTYEPYTGGQASPNPDYPQEVKTVKGYRNLFDIADGTYTVGTSPSASITFKDGAMTSLTHNFSQSFGMKIPLRTPITLKANTTYTRASYSNYIYPYIALYDIDSKTVDTMAASDKGIKTYTPTQDVEIHYIYFWFTHNYNYTELKPMMVEGEKILPFVPYGTNWIYTEVSNGTDTNYYTIPLNDNEICGIGDYRDELIVDKNGHCWLNKKLSKKIFTENDNWVRQSVYTNNTRYVLNDSNVVAIPGTTILSNYFLKGVGGSDTTNIAINGGNGWLMITIPNTIAPTLVDFKNWLQTKYNEDNPVYALYVTTTPQLIDLNYTVDIELFKGINNISNSEDMDMEIKYIKDAYE